MVERNIQLTNTTNLVSVELGLVSTGGAELELARVAPVSGGGGGRDGLELDLEADLTHTPVRHAHGPALLPQQPHVLLQLFQLPTLPPKTQGKGQRSIYLYTFETFL